jgi:hypothetical protein
MVTRLAPATRPCAFEFLIFTTVKELPDIGRVTKERILISSFRPEKISLVAARSHYDCEDSADDSSSLCHCHFLFPPPPPMNPSHQNPICFAKTTLRPCHASLSLNLSSNLSPSHPLLQKRRASQSRTCRHEGAYLPQRSQTSSFRGTIHRHCHSLLLKDRLQASLRPGSRERDRSSARAAVSAAPHRAALCIPSASTPLTPTPDR